MYTSSPYRHDRQRQELLSGAQRSDQDLISHRVTEQQLVQQATEQHKETTKVYGRAAQIVKDTEDLAAATNANLYDQGAQLEEMHGKFAQMDDDLSRANKDLSRMNRSCLAWLCCCCCDPDDPKPRRQAVYGGGLQRQLDMHHLPRPTPQQQLLWEQQQQQYQQQHRHRHQQQHQQQQPQRQQPGPDTRGLRQLGYSHEADEVEHHTRAQNDHLDTIMRGLHRVHGMAEDMQVELQRQNDVMDHAHERADGLNDKVARVTGKGRAKLARM